MKLLYIFVIGTLSLYVISLGKHHGEILNFYSIYFYMVFHVGINVLSLYMCFLWEFTVTANMESHMETYVGCSLTTYPWNFTWKPRLDATWEYFQLRCLVSYEISREISHKTEYRASRCELEYEIKYGISPWNFGWRLICAISHRLSHGTPFWLTTHMCNFT